jgi:hypothetical protein
MRWIGDKLVDLGELFPEGNAEVGEVSQKNLLNAYVSFLFYLFLNMKSKATATKVGTDFADKRRSLGRYSSLSD